MTDSDERKEGAANLEEFRSRLKNQMTPEQKAKAMGLESEIDWLIAERDRTKSQIIQLQSELSDLRELETIRRFVVLQFREPGRLGYANEKREGHLTGKTLGEIIHHFLMKERNSISTRLRYFLGLGAW
jgi:hypothetical protein